LGRGAAKVERVEIADQYPTAEEWESISRKLREPFDPTDVDFRVQGRVNEQTNKAQVLAYIDARAVQDRLDSVVGCGNWSFDWSPIVSDNGEVMVAKGTLTIYGVSKSDAGSASNFEQSLGAVSHCFKRAAVQWGIGRYLYSLAVAWVTVERGGRIPEVVLRELRSGLPQPSERAAQAGDPPQPQHTVQVIDDAKPSTGRKNVAQVEPAPAESKRTTARLMPRQEPEALERQITSIRKLCEALGKPMPEGTPTYKQASQLLTELSAEYRRTRRAS
jgi:hypothetical protein